MLISNVTDIFIAVKLKYINQRKGLNVHMTALFVALSHFSCSGFQLLHSVSKQDKENIWTWLLCFLFLWIPLVQYNKSNTKHLILWKKKNYFCLHMDIFLSYILSVDEMRINNGLSLVFVVNRIRRQEARRGWSIRKKILHSIWS